MKATLLFTLALLLGFACFLTIGTAQTYVHHKTLLETDEGFKALAFSPDGTLLASGGFGGADNIYLHNPETGRLMHTLRGHTNTVNEVAFSPDGNLLASISRDTTVKLWNPQTGRLIRTLEGHQNNVIAVAFSPTGTLITGDFSGAMYRWTPAKPGEHRLVSRGNDEAVITAAYSSTGDFAIGDGNSGARRFGITVWAPGNDPQDPNRISSALHIDQQDWVHCVAFAATGELVSGSEDNTVSIFPPNSLRASKILRGHTQKVYWVDVSASGTIASASRDGTIRLWNLATGQHVATLDEHTNSVNTVAFSPNEKWLASGSTDGTVRLWRNTQGTVGTQQPQITSPAVGGFDPSAWVTTSPTAGEVFRQFYTTLEPANIRRAFSEILVALKNQAPANLSAPLVQGILIGKGMKAQYDTVAGANSSLFANSKVHTLLQTPVEIDAFVPVLRNSAQFDALRTYFTKPASITVKPSSKTVEPGNPIDLTVTVKQQDRSSAANTAVELKTNSPGWFQDASQQNVTTLGVVTNTAGEATVKLYTRETAASASSSTDTYSVTATVTKTKADAEPVTASGNYTAKWTPSRLSVSGTSGSITSGEKRLITARVYSSSGEPMSDVTVTFSESSSSLSFSPTSRKTNSSGRAETSLKTKGRTSGATVTVKASGISSKSYTVAVKPYLTSETLSKTFSSTKGSWSLWDGWDLDWEETDYRFDFSGPVAQYDIRTEASWVDENNVRLLSHGFSDDWDDEVDVTVSILEHRWEPNEIKVIVEAQIETVAGSFPAAPALDPQFRPETDPLPTFWQDLSQVPEKTALLPNYPNPFNPETWIPYRLAESAEVTLTIYSLNGNQVRTLALGHQPAGFYESRSRAAYWDGSNAIGERVASGVYFYTLTAGDFAATGKMLILK